MTRAADLLPRFLTDHLALTRRQVEADRLIGASLAGHLVHDLPRAADESRASDDLAPAPHGPPVAARPDPVRARRRGLRRARRRGRGARCGDGGPARRPVRRPRGGEGRLGAGRGAVVVAALPAGDRRCAAAAALADVVRRRRRRPRRWLVARRAGPRRHADGRRLRPDRPRRDGPGGRRAARPGGQQRPGVDQRLPAELRHALAATSAVAEPAHRRVQRAGSQEPAYVEHSSLARVLGFHLVEPPDLVVRKGRVWLRTLGGLDPIDVVYRRLADAAVDPIEVSATNTTGVPGLLFAATEGGVVLANAHGCGVLEDPVAGAVLAGCRRGPDRARASTCPSSPPTMSWPASRRSGRAGSARPTSSSGCTPSPARTASR